MLIRMKETRRGSEDAFVVRRFYKDCIYDVADTLARAFIKSGWASEVYKEGVMNDNTPKQPWEIMADVMKQIEQCFPSQRDAEQDAVTRHIAEQNRQAAKGEI